MKIIAGEYQGISDFINRNNLQKVFLEAVSGDRTIESYLQEYPENRDLVTGIITDLSAGEDWLSRVKFKNGHSSKFSFTP